MTAKINITTPSGKSLEGFPREFDSNHIKLMAFAGPRFAFGNSDECDIQVELQKGDIITIEVL